MNLIIHDHDDKAIISEREKRQRGIGRNRGRQRKGEAERGRRRGGVRERKGEKCKY